MKDEWRKLLTFLEIILLKQCCVKEEKETVARIVEQFSLWRKKEYSCSYPMIEMRDCVKVAEKYSDVDSNK